MIIQLLIAFVCVGIFWRSMCVINYMSKKTRHVIRVTWWILSVGSAACIVYPLMGEDTLPFFGMTLILIGLAGLCVFDRRTKPGSFGRVV